MVIRRSEDNGQSWQAEEAVNDNRTLEDGKQIHSSSMMIEVEQNTEAPAVQLSSGTVLIFMRNLLGNVQSAKSHDRGQSWHDGITDVYCQLAAIQTVQEG